ncbi:MAG: hypothetical protein RLZZ59_726 [Pseudomonadota bacterium]|jgi:hypothetical protein
MVTLLASIAGFITSLIPEVLRFFKDRLDKQHELQIMEKQIRFSKNPGMRSPEEIYMTRDMIEQISLYSTYKTGINWVDALNGTVRPVLAYSFFLMYAAIKIIQYSYITRTTLLVEYIDVIWSVDDQAIFASIVSFYFGQRAFSKIRRTR